jgi:hypothetical protein
MDDRRRIIASTGIDGRGQRPSNGLPPVSQSLDEGSETLLPFARLRLPSFLRLDRLLKG